MLCDDGKTLLEIYCRVVDPEYKEYAEGVQKFYLKKGSLSDQQVKSVINTLRFKIIQKQHV